MILEERNSHAILLLVRDNTKNAVTCKMNTKVKQYKKVLDLKDKIHVLMQPQELNASFCVLL